MIIINPSAAARQASPSAVRRAARSDLSFRARLAYVALLLVGTGGALATATLWATEPALPVRTHMAFGALTALNLGWAGLATWVLGTRRVLLGYDRVIAGRMAVTFSGVFIAGMTAAAVRSGRGALWGGVAVGWRAGGTAALSLLAPAAALAALRGPARRARPTAGRRVGLSRQRGPARPRPQFPATIRAPPSSYGVAIG